MTHRLCWITDPHLSFLPTPEGSRSFGQYLRSELDFDSVVLTGDIAEANTIEVLLPLFADGIGDKPVYYITGNHDYYYSTIEEVETRLAQINIPNLHWLEIQDTIPLDESTALVGQFAWYDGGYGRAQLSRVEMSDFEVIGDFRQHYSRYEWAAGHRGPLLGLLRRLAQAQTELARTKLVAACAARETVIFATHVPPFAGATWHEGRISDPHWLPWFSCQTMGQMLTEVADKHPENKILVLCGHTHGQGVYMAAPNLRVLTGRAEYGAPDVAALLVTPYNW